MKKTYINPVMDVVELKMSNALLAGSTTSVAIGTGYQDVGGAAGREDDGYDW